MGFFKDAGLDVKLTFLLNGQALTSALASGALDLAVASVGVVADLNNTTIAINGLRDLTQFTLLKYLKLQPEIAKTMTRAAYDTSGTLAKSFPAAELIAQP